MKRDGSRCFYCTCDLVPPGQAPASRQLTVDHRQPTSKGGSNRLSNLVLACAVCNARKSDMSELEYRNTRRFRLRLFSISNERKREERERSGSADFGG